MELTDRFLKYVSFDTQSSEENESERPSTQKQFELARYLRDELESLGLQDVEIDPYPPLALLPTWIPVLTAAVPM